MSAPDAGAPGGTTGTPPPETPSRRELLPRRGPGRFVLWFFVVAAVLSGIGFGVKIYEFAEDMLRDQGIGFAGAHLVTYLFVAVGFLLLLAGTFLRGHYADIERPKYDLLERERLHDRTELAGPRHRG